MSNGGRPRKWSIENVSKESHTWTDDKKRLIKGQVAVDIVKMILEEKIILDCPQNTQQRLADLFDAF